MSDEIRIVLIGKTGVGKSSTGNTLLNAQKFKAECSASSATRKCRKEVGKYGSRDTIIVDTPGLCDTELSEEEIMREIVKCVAILSQGIHAFAFIVSTAARFTTEEQKAIQSFAERFGENIYTHGIVVFTRFDDLRKKGKSIEDYLSTAPNQLKYIVELCGHRYVALENDALLDGDKEKQGKQVDEFFTKVQYMTEKNGGKVYTNDMLEASEAIMQLRLEKEREKILEDTKKRDDELEKRMMLRIKEAKSEELEELKRELAKEKESNKREGDKKIEIVRQVVREDIVKEKPGIWDSWLKDVTKIVVDGAVQHLFNKNLVKVFSTFLNTSPY